jgi:hypothetical protein
MLQEVIELLPRVADRVGLELKTTLAWNFIANSSQG